MGGGKIFKTKQNKAKQIGPSGVRGVGGWGDKGDAGTTLTEGDVTEVVAAVRSFSENCYISIEMLEGGGKRELVTHPPVATSPVFVKV